MIVSHQHRFVFLAVPRTATHSVRRALRPHLGAGDWEQQMLSARQTLPVDELAALGHGHISVRQAEAHLPDPVWRKYLKFAFVRHPFDRFVSACRFLNRGSPDFAGRETAWMKQALTRPRFRQRILVASQASLLLDARGRLGVDFLGRYERLQADFADLCRQLGLPSITLARTNAAPDAHPGANGCAPAREPLDAELEAQLAELYGTDLRTFGYTAAHPRRERRP